MPAEAAQLNNLPAETEGKAARDKLEVLRRLAAGEWSTAISTSMGLERSAISQRYRNDPDYKLAREIGMDTQLEDMLNELKAAGDNINLARVREILLRRLEWRAEREFPHRWGPKTHVTVEQVGDLGDKLRRSRERVIEAEPVADAQHAAAQEAGVEKP